MLIFLLCLLLCCSCAAFISSPFLQFPVNLSARGSAPAADSSALWWDKWIYTSKDSVCALTSHQLMKSRSDCCCQQSVLPWQRRLAHFSGRGPAGTKSKCWFHLLWFFLFRLIPYNITGIEELFWSEILPRLAWCKAAPHHWFHGDKWKLIWKPKVHA